MTKLQARRPTKAQQLFDHLAANGSKDVKQLSQELLLPEVSIRCAILELRRQGALLSSAAPSRNLYSLAPNAERPQDLRGGNRRPKGN